MTDTIQREATSLDTTSLPVVSADSHVGPPPEALRPYCPKEYLEEFDAAVTGFQKMMEAMGGGPFRNQDQSIEQGRIMVEMVDRNAGPGHYDMNVRLAQMDEDGTVSEVMYHGSQNNNPIPLVGPAGFTFDHAVSKESLKSTMVGLHIYNEWLADACSIAPERLLGALHLPQWDPELSVEELKWGAEHGLRVVNLSAPRAGILQYDDPAWDPFWSACEEYQCILTTHAGAIDFSDLIAAGAHSRNLVELEAG